MSRMRIYGALAGWLVLSVVPAAGAAGDPPGPGDDKRGYESRDYVTRSRSLATTSRAATSLMQVALAPPLGLPPVPVPADNPLSADRVALGRKLFFDRRLSGNGTMSCAMCHVPEHGFTHNEMRTAVGIEGRSGRRNAPTVLNVAYQARLFRDGRETSLETQVWSPLLAANEMGNPSVGFVLETIQSLDDYDGLFERAYGRGPGMETVGQALASYQRTLLAADSPFDRWQYGGDEDALPEAAKRGFALFTGKARCSACHLVGEDWSLLTDGRYHNTGVGVVRTTVGRKGRSTITIAPGQTLTVSTEGVEHIGGRPLPDLGRYEITGDPSDRWRYLTPGLRNVALTAPYMHDGSLATLDDVVRFYDSGGVANDELDPLIVPLGLTDGEVADLVAFLTGLTGSNVRVLVADALAASIGDP